MQFWKGQWVKAFGEKMNHLPTVSIAAQVVLNTDRSDRVIGSKCPQIYPRPYRVEVEGKHVGLVEMT